MGAVAFSFLLNTMSHNGLQLMAGGNRRLVYSRLTLGAVMLVRWQACKAVLFY